ncbi:MAG: hypothetical protein MI924_23845, partial [Chloroflexales bacterium]|nr:hypothetical protein [Chloroflexales bacterium]
MDVRRVAREKDPAHPELLGHPAVDAILGDPARVRNFRVDDSVLAEDLLDVVAGEGLFAVEFGGNARDDAVLIGAIAVAVHGAKHQHILARRLGVECVAGQRPVQVHVGHEQRVGIGGAVEGEAQRFAHEAARPVGGDEPAR